MFEGVIAAGGHGGREVIVLGERRHHRRHVGVLLGTGADQPGTAGAEHPFVGAGNKEITMHVGEVEVFHAETVHTVDHVEDAILVVTVAVVFIHQFADLANRQFDAAAGLHPRHAKRLLLIGYSARLDRGCWGRSIIGTFR